MPVQDMINKLLPFFAKKEAVDSGKFFGTSEKGSKVDFILSEFTRAMEHETGNIDRMEDSWKMYSGLDDGQWPDDIKAKMKKEKRNPFQANFIRQKVDGLAGALIKNSFDINFEPVDTDHSDQVKFIKELMYVEKELMDWNVSYRDLIVDGLIQLGVEEMFISDRYSPFGNIGFKRILPGHIILDPDWLTNNTWELRRAWKTAYLRARDIKNIYDVKGDEIEAALAIRKGIPDEFDNGSPTAGFPHKDMSETYGEKYRVIEYHHMEKEKKTIEIIVANGIVVPEGPDDFKREWAILNKVDLSEGVMKRTVEVDTYYITTICPSLSKYLVLEDRKARIQIGRLPFFPWSVARINGRNSGIPELLKSIQITYNKRESMLDHIIATSANGAAAIDPNLVDGDENMMRAVQENWNIPGYKFWTTPGALASGREFVKEMPRSTVDWGVTNQLTRMVDLFDRISKQPAAMDGRSEGSEETGILYARKSIQAEITIAMIHKSLEQHWNDKGEAYVVVAKQLHSGVYREFNMPGKDGESISINKPTITPSGEIIENDIANLPRMKIIVSQSPDSVTQRSIDRAINVEVLRVIGPENPLSRSRAVKNVIKTLDGSNAERKQAEEDAEFEHMINVERAKTEMMSLKFNQAQLQMQLQQLMQPQMPNMDQIPPQQGEGGEEQPQEQGEPPRGPGNPEQTVGGQDAVIASAEGLV